jgi:hypothetical protein
MFCSWRATRRPPCVELNCPKVKFRYIRAVTTVAQGTVIMLRVFEDRVSMRIFV